MENSQTVTPSKIAAMWGMPKSDLVVQFLDAQGVEPISQFPYGRGIMRIYSADVLNLREGYVKFRDKRINSGLQALAANANRKKNGPLMADRLTAIEAKLDRLLALWSNTP